MFGIQFIRYLFRDKVLATLMLVLFNILFIPIEQGGFSPVKIGLMGLCPLIFFAKKPIVTKALMLCALYWIVCYLLSLLKGDVRFSTLGFLGMYLILFITYYTFIIKGTFTLDYFSKVLKWLIIAYCLVLLGQQLCLLAGVRNMPLLNLQGQEFLSLTKLPSLSIEPSHTARILTFAMLGYMRCAEIRKGEKVAAQELFGKEHRWVTLSFLWTMLTMGSGTAFVGIGVLSLYFVTRKTAVYVVPLIIGLFLLGQSLELKQMNRAVALAQAASTGDAQEIMNTDGSGAVRLIPVVNAFTKTDLTDPETWVGKSSMQKDKNQWKRTDTKIYEQYGIVVYAILLCFVFSCVIYRFASIETLLYLCLLGFSVSNIYYIWGCFMIMATVRYFQEQSWQEALSRLRIIEYATGAPQLK